MECEIVIYVFEPQSRYYILLRTDTLRKGKNRFIPQDIHQVSRLLFFYKDRFSIKYTTKVDIPLKQAEWNPVNSTDNSKNVLWSSFSETVKF